MTPAGSLRVFNRRRIESLERRVTELKMDVLLERDLNRDVVRAVAEAVGLSIYWMPDQPGHWTVTKKGGPEEPES